jgi:hypothetical protein
MLFLDLKEESSEKSLMIFLSKCENDFELIAVVLDVDEMRREEDDKERDDDEVGIDDQGAGDLLQIQDQDSDDLGLQEWKKRKNQIFPDFSEY